MSYSQEIAAVGEYSGNMGHDNEWEVGMGVLEEVKTRLARDFASSVEEWEYVTSFGQRAESERLALFKWVFTESPAYWATRARAGQVLLGVDEEGTWEIVEGLVASSDPDDNGTALTLFETLNDPRGVELARRWLTDEANVFTQLEAAVYLQDVYPEQVRQRLQVLADHPTPNIQKWAQSLLDKMER
jgi:hypothetical protein